MKKIALIASAVLLTVGIAGGAQAQTNGCSGHYDHAAVQCYWTWHDDYKVKKFTTTAEHGQYYPYIQPGSPCLEVLNDLTSSAAAGHTVENCHSPWWLEESTGNSLKDTHLLKRCVEYQPCD